MKIDLPSQFVIDETVEDLLTERHKPSVWIESALKAKRSAGRLYFGTSSENLYVPFVLNKPSEEAFLVYPKSAEPPADLGKLKERVAFLEAQLESHRPYLQLFRFGAGSLFLAVLSILTWLLNGTGIPFHPVFAAGVVPAALGVIAMSFLIRPKPQK